MPIVAIVPPCAGECRLVRVTGVLIFADSRTCVTCVLPAAGPLGHHVGARLRTGGLARGSKTSCRDYPSASRPSGCSWRHCRNDVTCRRECAPNTSNYAYRRIGAHIISDSLVGMDGHNCCSGAAGAGGLVLRAGMVRASHWTRFGHRRARHWRVVSSAVTVPDPGRRGRPFRPGSGPPSSLLATGRGPPSSSLLPESGPRRSPEPLGSGALAGPVVPAQPLVHGSYLSSWPALLGASVRGIVIVVCVGGPARRCRTRPAGRPAFSVGQRGGGKAKSGAVGAPAPVGGRCRAGHRRGAG